LNADASPGALLSFADGAICVELRSLTPDWREALRLAFSATMLMGRCDLPWDCGACCSGGCDGANGAGCALELDLPSPLNTEDNFGLKDLSSFLIGWGFARDDFNSGVCIA
jgi:hypothetical protein